MKFSEVFKRLFWGYLVFGSIVGIPISIMTLIGKVPITINGEPRTGLIGLLIPLVYIPLFSAISALLNGGILMLGQAVVGKSRKDK